MTNSGVDVEAVTRATEAKERDDVDVAGVEAESPPLGVDDEDTDDAEEAGREESLGVASRARAGSFGATGLDLE